MNEYKKIFINFLRKNKIEKEFKKILKTSGNLDFNEYLEELFPDDFISGIFPFLDTPEQIEFWSDIDDEWMITESKILNKKHGKL